MKSPTFTVSLVLATACCLAGPPDKPNAAKNVMDGPLAPLIYPGATFIGGAAGGGGGGSGMNSAGHSMCIRTADSFEAVSAFYSKMLFPEDEVDKHGFRIPASKPPGGLSFGDGGSGGGGGRSGLGSGGSNRPLKMAMLNTHWNNGSKAVSATVVLSRGDHEEWTYIHLVKNVVTTTGEEEARPKR